MQKLLTSLDGGQQRQESNGVRDRLLSLEPSGTQYPGRRGVHDEYVEEKSREAREVISAAPSIAISAFLRHDG